MGRKKPFSGLVLEEMSRTPPLDPPVRPWPMGSPLVELRLNPRRRSAGGLVYTPKAAPKSSFNHTQPNSTERRTNSENSYTSFSRVSLSIAHTHFSSVQFSPHTVGDP